MIRFKARLVARGDKQREGVDFINTFTLVARMASFWLFVALSALLGLEIYSCDVNTAYFNANVPFHSTFIVSKDISMRTTRHIKSRKHCTACGRLDESGIPKLTAFFRRTILNMDTQSRVYMHVGRKE